MEGQNFANLCRSVANEASKHEGTMIHAILRSAALGNYHFYIPSKHEDVEYLRGFGFKVAREGDGWLVEW